MSLFLLLVATGGWSGFTRTVGNSSIPVPVVVVLCGKQMEGGRGGEGEREGGLSAYIKGAWYSYRSVVLRNVLSLSARRPQIDSRA